MHQRWWRREHYTLVHGVPRVFLKRRTRLTWKGNVTSASGKRESGKAAETTLGSPLAVTAMLEAPRKLVLLPIVPVVVIVNWRLAG